ncbi:hypothetical protein Btus_0891 [Kyrpidia tusciae DSM 2912]|uniref:Uncharacterized protein n=1 Tax=Kyrpidia tusciae (strain DSM 2912 / NBRC 15312 / T2) TaxID=562970 RepID=D5WW03_KYRT2|nr:hypothetical protein Btus_0891 [Kyrpidia tusciae DSM 2912]
MVQNISGYIVRLDIVSGQRGVQEASAWRAEVDALIQRVRSKIAGYRDVLRTIHEHHEHMRLTSNLTGWHSPADRCELT